MLLPALPAESEDVLHPLDVVHDPGVELRPQLQLPLPQPSRERPHQERHPDAGGRERSLLLRRPAWGRRSKDEGGERADGERHGHGGEGAQVDVLQLLDVLHDAGEKIPAAVAQEAGRREGREAGVEAGPSSASSLNVTSCETSLSA